MESLEVAKRLAGGWPARVLIALLVAVTLVVGTRPALDAAPSPPVHDGVVRAQNVGWLSAESAAELAGVEFDVLVPTAVPGPFGGEPAIDASGGAYSLYWMIPGGVPTFLEMTGVAGGEMPAGSPNDLNIPLEINAQVQGHPAIHDLTEIYDNVWWQAGGVLYSISSRNLTTTDSLSLANALIPLVIPEPVEEEPVEEPIAEEPVEEPAPAEEVPVEEPAAELAAEEPVEEPTTAVAATLILPELVGSGETTRVAADGIDSATLVADDGIFPDTGSTTYPGMRSWDVFWQAPSVSGDTVVSFTLIEPVDGAVLASGQLIVVAPQTSAAAPEEVVEVAEPASEVSVAAPVVEEPATEPTQPDDQPVVADGTGGVLADVPTDGTDGPTPPVFGSDGTGGIKQVSVVNGGDEEP